MSKFWVYGVVIVLILSGISYVIGLIKTVETLETESQGLLSIIHDTIQIEVSPDGKKVATQAVVEVSKQTFSALQGQDIKGLERSFDLKFGFVEEKLDLVMTTVSKSKAVVHDTVFVKSSSVPGGPSGRDSVRAKVIHFKGRWKREKITLIGDTAYSSDTSTIKLVRLKVKGKRTKSFLGLFRYGPRKQEYKTLIFNPDTGIDTLSQINIIQ